MISKQAFPILLLNTILLILLSGCHLEKLDPIKNGLLAEFSYSVSGPDLYVPIEVSFVNLSAEATSYEWDFGDGSPKSTEFNPTHTYYKEGDHTVTLKAINDIGEEDYFQLPITMVSRKFRKEYYLGGSPREIFIETGRVLNDSTYQFAGHIYFDSYGGAFNTKPVEFSIGLDGNLTAPFQTEEYYGYSESNSRFASIPNYYLDLNIPTTIDYDNYHNLNISSFEQPDLFLVYNYDQFGKPIDIAENEENVYIVGRYNDKTNLLNVHGGADWPISIENQCMVFDIEKNHGNGIVVLGRKSDNSFFPECENVLMWHEYQASGELVLFTEIPFLDSETLWKLFTATSGKYYLFGLEFGSLKIIEYNSQLEKIGEMTLSNVSFQPKFIAEASGGGLFIAGEDSGHSSTIFLLKLDNNFVPMWTRTFNFPTKVTALKGILATSDFGGLLFGNYYAGFNPYYPFFIKFDENGNYE